MSYLFSVFDRVAGVYGAPFVCPNEAAAQRILAYEVNSVESSMLFRSSPDFDLVGLGEFDDSTGVIAPCARVAVVCNLSSLKAADAISVANRAGTGESDNA